MVEKEDASWRITARSALAQGAGAGVVAIVCYASVRQISFLHETYWAPIAALVVLYPDREATAKAGADRFLGTLIGSAIGWLSASWWHENLLLYGVAIAFAVGICHLLRVGAAARLCAVAVTVITIIPHPESPSLVAFYRCIEVSYGVACAWVYTLAVEWLRRRVGP